jgi:hypothetical protein
MYRAGKSLSRRSLPLNKQSSPGIARPELLCGILSDHALSDAQTLITGFKRVNGAELPAGITCEDFASEY